MHRGPMLKLHNIGANAGLRLGVKGQLVGTRQWFIGHSKPNYTAAEAALTSTGAPRFSWISKAADNDASKAKLMPTYKA